ncbi:MAG: cell division protein FtsA [Candidatus Pacebacteria bacterium]|nr:cell division protein FtsA [Candidatus Paceibacterota bacterium]
MTKPQLVTGIDIGTDTIKILTVKKNIDTGDIQEVLFFDKVRSAGVQKGRIQNPNEVGKKIQDLITKAERKFDGEKLDEIYVNINGSRVEMIPSQETILVARANGKVTIEDVERAIVQVQEKIAPSLTNKEILSVYPKEWILDEEGDIKNPVGLQGYKLKLDALVSTCFYTDKENIAQSLAIADADCDENSIIASTIADARAILSPELKELGVAIVNIGSGTTSVIVYQEGKLVNSVIFPLGSSNITNDIAIGFKTEIEIAEKIKQQFGCCFGDARNINKKKIDFDLDQGSRKNYQDDEEVFRKKIEIDGRPKKKVVPEKAKKPQNCFSFYERDLKKIIEARVNEILELTGKEISRSVRSGSLPGGVIIVGGGAKLPGIIEMAKREYNLPCRIGYAKNFSGLDKDPSLVTVCGLVSDELESEDSGPVSSGSSGGIIKKLVDIFKNFIP